ncbi:phosphoribosylanthranilate isomerase [Salinibacterium sp. ZJ70]|uniref:phosphoribosylanthranilate isomerase n=1 Tax=Salinibacterium sp. ZJ70 TaxID=2708084 RepID=UPI00141ED097|nr:phosphoribosylanthranilate isomerase [Salinibacterium sp. ZJ70]
MFIKICGIRDAATADACVALGVDALGFVFAEGSVRRITADDAAAVVASVPARVETVGVFTDAPIESVIDDVRRAGLRTAQLHGERSAAEIAQLRDAGIDVIVAHRVGESSAHPGIRLLIDGDVPGSGTAFSVDRLDRAALPAQWLLAGGLDADNVASRIRALAPTGVDVSSGVESERGVKSIPLIERFVAAVRAAG